MSIKGHVDYSGCSKAAAAPKPKPSQPGRYRFCSQEQRGTPWTEAETALLRKLWGTTRSEDIAKALGRKLVSVNHRASVIGLPKRPARVMGGA